VFNHFFFALREDIAKAVDFALRSDTIKNTFTVIQIITKRETAAKKTGAHPDMLRRLPEKAR
jgi:hypothetical protein